MFFSYCDSPVGRLLLNGTREALYGLWFSSGSKARGPQKNWHRRDDLFDGVKLQLQEYFEGQRRRFDIPLVMEGTPFQCQVWAALEQIPYGETRSYAEVAQSIDNPKAVRAVGSANGNNPIAIIVPCHRVIGSNGTLTGFGGGLEAKRRLLELELSSTGLWAGQGPP